MNAQAALLYRLEAAWQSPRVAGKTTAGGGKRGGPKASTGGHGDPPAVAVPTPDLAEHPTLKIGGLWYGLAAAQAVVLAVVIGSYFQLTSKIDQQTKRLDALVKWLDNPKSFPATKSIADPDNGPDLSNQSKVTPPSPSALSLPAPPTLSSVPVSLDPPPQKQPAAPVSAIPPTARPLAPPVCVGKLSKRRFACEDAKQCWERSAFNPDYWESIRTKVGADQMLLCDPK